MKKGASASAKAPFHSAIRMLLYRSSVYEYKPN